MSLPYLGSDIDSMRRYTCYVEGDCFYNKAWRVAGPYCKPLAYVPL